nr:Rid family hydrolase [Bacillus sonorensis]
MYVSGQFAIDPITQEKKFGTIEEETLQALSNIAYILKKAGSHKDKMLKVTLYLHDIGLLDRVDNVYQGVFDGYQPARSIVPTNSCTIVFRLRLKRSPACNIFFCLCCIKKYMKYKKIYDKREEDDGSV